MENRIKEIQRAIAEDNYETAEELLQKYRTEGAGYDDIIAILDAAVGEYYHDRKRVWEAIKSGLEYNCRNYELYVMLGNYYLQENLYQSWLCYENALFYCEDEEDRMAIRQLLSQLKEEYHVSVNKAAIVILSYNLLEYTKLCIDSIRETTPESAREIIVVDNASRDGSVEWLREQTDLILIENTENMGFPAGCNQGIQAASEESDIFLLNNDTILPVNALFWLRMGLYDKPENGTAGSVSNAARGQQVADELDNVPDLLAFAQKRNLPMDYPYESRIFLIGFALLIKRSVLNQTGLLDERFSPGNSEDEDYGLRVLMAGYKNILCRNSFVLHFGHKSFQKNKTDFRDVLMKNRRKLNEKWGFNTEYYFYPYFYPREDLLRLIQEPLEMPLRVLDIGCGCGVLLGAVKGMYPNADVYGVELVPEAAKIAGHMGNVICGDVENIDFPWEEEYFDYIIMGDVLEDLISPETVLLRLRKHLKTDGHIIVSMPNVKHYSVLLPLLRQDVFPYADEGILNSVHRKLYTGVEIQKLIAGSGYTVEFMDYTTLGKPSETEEVIIDMLSGLMKTPFKESFLAYQYLFKAVKR